MAHLSAAESRTVSEAFGLGTGYVMDFTNQSFGSFFRKHVGVSINDEKWHDLGSSKGKRLTCFLDKAPDDLALKALEGLWAYREETGWKSSWHTEEQEAALPAKMEALLDRMRAGRRGKGIQVAEPALWLAKVSAQCRLIQRTCYDVLDELDTGKKSVKLDERTKQLLTVYADQLEALLPDDFPVSSLPNLRRHISFNESGDMEEIIRFDMPGMMEKAEKYAQGAVEQHESEFDIRSLVDELFRQRLLDTLGQGHPDYHALVLNCAVRLSDLFKGRSGLTDDDMGMIGKAFSLKDPVLMLPPNLDTETNRNLQSGAMHLLQGARAFFRNTHAHGVQPTDQDMAYQALMLFSLCVQILISARRVDE